VLLKIEHSQQSVHLSVFQQFAIKNTACYLAKYGNMLDKIITTSPVTPG
jgi:hypothetical protein